MILIYNILKIPPKKKKPLDLINTFNKDAAYDTGIQISVALLHTNNGLSEREIKNRVLFTTAWKTVKYLEINLTKEVKDFYPGNCKTRIKKKKQLKKTGITCKVSCLQELEELILLKCPQPCIDSM